MGDDLGLPQDGHIICVTYSTGHDMKMEVFLPCTGGLPQVEPDIEPLWFQVLFQYCLDLTE